MDLIVAKHRLRTALLARINAVPAEERPSFYEAVGRLTTLVGIIRALQARASVQTYDTEGVADLCSAALLDAAASLKEIFYDDIDAFEEALAALLPQAHVTVTPTPGAASLAALA